MNLDQTIINWALGGVSFLLGSILTAVWNAVKDLQAADKDLTSRVAAIDVLVAGQYVKRSELDRTIDALFHKLDVIESKLDRKADK